jgi:hypothetical protein
MAVAARRIAAQYDPDACAARLLGLYEDLIRAWQPAPVHARTVHTREA